MLIRTSNIAVLFAAAVTTTACCGCVLGQIGGDICRMDEAQACVCPGGGIGVQQCAGDGSRWGVCLCGGNGGSGNGSGNGSGGTGGSFGGGSQGGSGSIPPPDCEVVDCEGPPYPRTACWTWGGMSPDWAARFDLVVMWRDDSLAAAIKAISPKTLVLPTWDWNVGGPLRANLPKEYAVRKADGKPFEVYCKDCGEYMADFTDCLGSPDCGVHNGKRFTDALIDSLAVVDFDLYDGLSTDGFWNNPGPWGPLPKIDLDRNGIDDNDEHGYQEWVRKVWTDGTASFLSRLRDRIGHDKPLVINSGAFHGWWWEEHNGPLLEGAWALYSWPNFYDRYVKWMATAPKPHLLVVDGKHEYDVVGCPKDEDTYYRLMRFLLGTTLLGDGYFEFSDAEGPSHNWVKYYDEFDLELGYPTGDPQSIAKGVFVRFFSGGALILNANPSSVTLGDADLASLPGYQGPYFRFRGGQDPGHNDGSELGTVTLAGSLGKSHSDVPVAVGDAIIVMRAAVDVVADIVVDDRGTGLD
ncbi:MAG: putative glycoside hydrolase family 15 protein [Armatimonadetes bacterium]|nr:putative glycoside hydrolase family 15 protein [Armatimonadota bacterium]